jgi:hypothetical protein
VRRRPTPSNGIHPSQLPLTNGIPRSKDSSSRLGSSNNQKGADTSITNNEIAVVITSANESLDRTVSLDDRDELKKLKKRVTNILNDAIDHRTA